MPFFARGPEFTGRTLHLSDPAGRGANPATVFIIDHDAAVRDALSVTLRDNGFHVRTHRSAGDFFGALPIRRGGCLLIEFDLVDMSGVELVARLNVDRVALPAIIMSARLRIPDIGNPHPLGVTGILQKPFGQDELLHCVRRALREL
ncbi:MAG: response regulator transcription factor [Geminicoccaceae bacterium]